MTLSSPALTPLAHDHLHLTLRCADSARRHRTVSRRSVCRQADRPGRRKGRDAGRMCCSEYTAMGRETRCLSRSAGLARDSGR
jgi:hypothetical protein